MTLVYVAPPAVTLTTAPSPSRFDAVPVSFTAR